MKHLRFAWVVSLVATLGSLYFSEIKHFIPCDLCWYQRILMYPLVIFLGVGMLRNEGKLYYYVLPFSIIGMLLSGFHYLKQKVDFFSEIGVCSSGVSCSGEYINWFGFVTIPFLAFTAFTLITITMFLMLKNQKSTAE